MKLETVRSDFEKPESIRLAHLGLESRVKSIGQLCYLVAFFSLLGTVEFSLFALGKLPVDEFKSILSGQVLELLFWSFALLFAVNTLVQIVLGRGLIQLRPWARWTVVVLTVASLVSNTITSLSLCLIGPGLQELTPQLGFKLSGMVVGLVGLLVGGLIHLVILWPLVGPGSAMIFSKEYAGIIRRTPEIRSRMHWLLKSLIGIILAAFAGFVGYLLLLYFRFID